jgi:DNA-binding response OmpR family regulator
MRAPYHLLIVEDSDDLRVLLRDLFEAEGFQVTVALNGSLALDMLLHLGPFDLVVLDVSLPGMDGFEVLARLRAAEITTPVVIFTGHGREADVLRGFELGADDYVTKPVHAEELLARVACVLKRSLPPNEAPMKVHRIGAVEVNFSTHEAFCRDEPLPWTAVDFDILRYLLANRGRMVPHEELLQHVTGLPPDDGIDALEAHLEALRDALEPDREASSYLEAVDGLGYRLET